MSRRRHRRESPWRARLRALLPPGRARGRVAVAGVAVAVLALGWVAVFVLRSGTGTGTQAAEIVAAAERSTAVDAQALRADAVLKANQRASRSRARPSTAPTVRPSPVATVAGRLWVTSTVNVRTGPSARTNRVGALTVGSRAAVTGKRADGWTQVLTDGRTGWVKSTYLSASKPKPKPVAAPSGVSDAACSISPGIEAHLTSHARSVYRAVCAEFGRTVSSFGGYRPGDSGDHGGGRAVDIMISGNPGWEVARYVQAHATALHVTYVIYQQQIWFVGDPISRWKAMADRGSATANHFDHVHVSVS